MGRFPVVPLAGNDVTDGRGFRAWRTRRANVYNQALRSLSGLAASRDLLGLTLSFAVIADFVEPFIRKQYSLPRGYSFSRNRFGDPTFIAPGGATLNPSPADPLPSLATVLQFADDIRSGWLSELARQVGLSGANSFLEEAR